MEVNNQLHSTAALPSEKEPSVPVGYEAEWDPEPVWTRWRREKFPIPTENWNTDRLARNLVVIPTELSRLV